MSTLLVPLLHSFIHSLQKEHFKFNVNVAFIATLARCWRAVMTQIAASKIYWVSYADTARIKHQNEASGSIQTTSAGETRQRNTIIHTSSTRLLTDLFWFLDELSWLRRCVLIGWLDSATVLWLVYQTWQDLRMTDWVTNWNDRICLTQFKLICLKRYILFSLIVHTVMLCSSQQSWTNMNSL